MLKNRSVRTKLVAVLAVPLVALMVLAGIGVQDRRAVAAEARAGQDLARLTIQRIGLAHELQLERLLTASVVAGDAGGSRARLDSQRASTDAEVEGFAAAAARARHGDGLAQRLDAVLAKLADRDAIRAAVDQGQVRAPVGVGYYDGLLDDLVELAPAIADAAQATELHPDLAALANLAAARQARATIASMGAEVTWTGRATPSQLAVVRDQRQRAAQQEQRFLDASGSAVRAASASPGEPAGSDRFDALITELAETEPGEATTVDHAAWMEAAADALAASREVADVAAAQIGSDAAAVEQAATSAAQQYLYVAGITVLGSLLLASVVARTITRPMSRLTQAAYELSEHRLPALVEQLRRPGEEVATPELPALPVGSRDEIGQLASAFNSIQDVTQQVAVEQTALLRKGISDIFVNLARRNQTLLNRQIEFIDDLEAREQDPDQLANLFRLDHLATRMRRNAESLLVLAGAEPPRRRGQAVPIADVVRVGMGEVEQFTRVNLQSLDEVRVPAVAAVDLAHLLSELMENATQFSPPESRVEVVGHLTRDRSYVLSVSDHGIGMTSEQLAEANRLLAAPPVVGLAMSRSLGLTVVARLASRLGITVRLTTSPAGGVAALVTLPRDVLEAPPETVEPAATVPAGSSARVLDRGSRPSRARAAHPAEPGPHRAEPAGHRAETAPPAWSAVASRPGAPTRPAAAVSTRHDSPDARGDAPSGTPAARIDVRGRSNPEPGASAPAAPPPLARRVPRHSEAPTTTREPAFTTATQRSPEEVRLMLSRYRAGRARGRGRAGRDRDDEGGDTR